jgi:hypothetical protein
MMTDRLITAVEIEKVLQLLAETPNRITTASKGHENMRLYFQPDGEAWSANDVLAHLRSCADVWGKSMLAMIDQDHPTLRYISPRTWIKKTDYAGQEFQRSLAAFARQRAELLHRLKALPIDGWSRGATFTATTKGREQTVLSYAQRLAEHERVHCEQIEALLS